MSNHAYLPRLSGMTFSRLATLAYLTVAVAFCAWYLCTRAGFYGDDVDHFILLQHTDFIGFLFSPVNNHFAPTHRLLTWIVYAIAPMRFGVAVSILIGIHVGILVYLYVLLRKLGASEGMSQVLVCCYASCQLSLYGMVWWAHAQHRLPFVLCSLAAIYHYLAWLDDRRTRSIVIAVCAYILALTTYEIAVLIPVYMIVFAALTRWDRLIANRFRNIAPAAILLSASLLYVAIYIHRKPGVGHQWDPTLSESLTALSQFAWSLAGSVLGMAEGKSGLEAQNPGLAEAVVLTFWGVLLAISLVFARTSWRPWVAGIVMLAISVLPIALSNRVTIFGNLLVSHYRYQFEFLYLIVLFAGVVGACWRREYSGRTPQPLALKTMAVAFVLAFAGCNLAGIATAARESTGELLYARLAHDYMSNLRAGLDSIPEHPPAFRNSLPPPFLAGWKHGNSTREIVRLFEPDATFGPGFKPRYLVKPDGTVVREGGS